MKIDVLQKIATALDVSADKILGLSIQRDEDVNGKLFSIDWGCGQNVGPNPLVYSPSRYT